MTVEKTPLYTCSKLNRSTYRIIHNDKYLEFPYIYLKVYSHPPLLVVVDTGCGAHNGTGNTPHIELKDFIEGHVLLHIDSKKYEYMVICTHCHFDHIGGIEAFARSGARILASGYDNEFLDPKNRTANSLCEAFGTSTPSYDVTRYLESGEKLQHNGIGLGLQALQTPGHTPDSLAIYDEREQWLFTGDTLYKRVATMPWGEQQDVPIILPLQGNWREFVASLEMLLAFVKSRESQLSSEQRIRLAAGHTTSDGIAADLLQSCLNFVRRVEEGGVPVVAKIPGDQIAPGGSLGDAEFWFWQDDGDPEYSLVAPEKFRKDFNTKLV